MAATTTLFSNNNNDDNNTVNEGLDYILSHFEYQMQLWPRTISTKTTEGKQIIVYSKEEAIARFKQANFMDCRISAYPYWRPSITSDFVCIKNAISPNFIMIDLDRCNFDYNDDDRLERILKHTLARIKELLAGYRPTVIWSGNGYHIYIPIESPVLENIKEFSDIDQVSTKFIRFAEWYLSNGKSDHAHNSTVSLNNCLLRIPGSINSKNNVQVEVVKRFDRKQEKKKTPPIPNINLLIGSFCAYLADQKIKETRYNKAIEQQQDQQSRTSLSPYNYNNSNNNNNNNHQISWIEKLIQTPLPDYRKNCIWRILAPYLTNVKHLSYEQSFNILARWLDNCSKLCRLQFNVKLKIKQDLDNAIKSRYYPIGLAKLKIADNELYNFLQNQGVISRG